MNEHMPILLDCCRRKRLKTSIVFLLSLAITREVSVMFEEEEEWEEEEWEEEDWEEEEEW